MRNQGKSQNTSLSSTFFPGSTSVLHSQLLYLPKGGRECRQLLSPHIFCLLHHGSFPQTAAPSGNIHQLWCAVLHWLFPQGNTCSNTQNTTSASPSLALAFTGLFLTLFTLYPGSILPFPAYILTEVPPALLTVPCGGALGAGWNQPRPLLTERPAAPLPTPRLLNQYNEWKIDFEKL